VTIVQQRQPRRRQEDRRSGFSGAAKLHKGEVAWHDRHRSSSADDMAFSITFNITAEPESTISAIMDAARGAGIQIQGDNQRGTFSGFNAKGTYSRDANQVNVTVTEKPFFVSERMVRKLAAEKAPEWGVTVV
jgi:hypothetical protein